MITDSFRERRVGAASKDDNITDHVVSGVYKGVIRAFCGSIEERRGFGSEEVGPRG